MSFWKKDVDPAAWLAGVAFFEGFSHHELQRVSALSTGIEAEVGALLIDQGDAGQYCYVIVEGRAAVYSSGEYVTSLSPGTTVGEMSLVGHRPRSASVIAETPMVLLRFEAPQFRQLLDEMPKASERVMTLLHDRMSGAPNEAHRPADESSTGAR